MSRFYCCGIEEEREEGEKAASGVGRQAPLNMCGYGTGSLTSILEPPVSLHIACTRKVPSFYSVFQRHMAPLTNINILYIMSYFTEKVLQFAVKQNL